MKKIIFVIAALTVIAALGGCSLLGIGTDSEPTAESAIIKNGTTTGNILNYGFGVQYGDDLIFRYYGDGVYPRGSIVRSNPETGENSLVLESGGLYMSIVSDELYYCTPQGVYKTALDNPEPTLALNKNVSLLQISDGSMYYIESGAIDSSTTSGEARNFARIENADCLNVYEEMIYYIGTNDNYIYSAKKDGTDSKVLFDQSVSMFYISGGVIYYIDSITGFIKSMSMDLENEQTIVEYSCAGFNINANNIYYTRDIGSVGTCCSARPNGESEETLDDFGSSDWHLACMWGDGAIVVRIEDLQSP